MLEQKFEIVYTKFKLHFYQEIFERFQNREASLTTVETFAMETIQALGCPTTVSYTHLDVYKRQPQLNPLFYKLFS